LFSIITDRENPISYLHNHQRIRIYERI